MFRFLFKPALLFSCLLYSVSILAETNQTQTCENSITLTVSKTSTCPYEPVTYTSQLENPIAYTYYTWKKNDTVIYQGMNSSIYTAPLKSTDSIWVELTDFSCNNTRYISNKIGITILPTIETSVEIVASSIYLNENKSIVLKAVPTNGGPNPTYSWNYNAVTIAQGEELIIDPGSYLYQPGNTFSVNMESSVTCPVFNYTSSNRITLKAFDPGEIAGTDTSCLSSIPSLLTNTRSASDYINAISYTWKSYNESNYTWTDIPGATSENYQPASLTNTTYYIRVASNGTSTENSNVIIKSVYKDLIPGAIRADEVVGSNGIPSYISHSVYCQNRGKNFSFQWKISTDGINWNNIQTPSEDGFETQAICQTTYFSCDYTNTCGTKSSNVVTKTLPTTGAVTYTPLITLNKYNYTSEKIEFSYRSTTVGYTPMYQWYLNNMPVPGATNNVYLGSTFKNNDEVFLEVTSDLSCFTNPIQHSDTIKININYKLIPDKAFRDEIKRDFPTCFNANDELDICRKEIQTCITYSVQGLGVSDLSGIEYFTSLSILNCSFNNLTSLPEFPKTLFRLYCNDNSISCLPLLPDRLYQLRAKNNPLKCLPNLPSNLSRYMSDIPLVLCNPDIQTNNCIQYPAIRGFAFFDENKNGVQDNNELPFANLKLSIQPDNYIITTNNEGFFKLFVPNTGTYTITPNTNSLLASAPIQNITTASTTPDETVFAIQPNGMNTPDLAVSVIPITLARPGFAARYYIIMSNLGNTALTSGLQLSIPNAFAIDSIQSDAQSNYSTSGIQWDALTITSGTSVKYIVYGSIKQNAVRGSEISFQATTDNIIGDIAPENNTSLLKQIIVGSYDPNDKTVFPEGDLSDADIANQRDLTYLIRFQNTGTDTAFTVVIRDTINSYYDIESMRIIASSHNVQTNISNGVIKFIFNNILLVDSFRNEPASHGFIKYSIKPKSTLQIGDEIKNTAYIYFDYNLPVATNTATSRIQNEISTSTTSGKNTSYVLYPNPARESFSVKSNMGFSFVQIKIYNSTGELVYMKSHVDITSEKIVVEGIKNGLYKVVISDNENSYCTSLVIE